MTTKHEVYDTHRANPTWGSVDIARALGCCDAYVRATAKRNGWSLPKRVRATPEEAAARRAGPQLLEALDHILLRQVLSFVEDCAPDGVMATLRLWQDTQRAAISRANGADQ